MQTPDTRGVIVGSIPELPEGWQPQIEIENRSAGYDRGYSLCQPFEVRVTNSASVPVDGVEVWLRTSSGQNILQGTTGRYESGSGIVDFGSGVIPITGVHIGDRISAGGMDYIIRESDCLETARRREDFLQNVQFVKVAASNILPTQSRTQSRAVNLRIPPDVVSMYPSIEPIDNFGQLVIRVRTDSPLRFSLKAQVTASGGTNALSVGMRYDAATQTYVSEPFKVPIGTYASLSLTGTTDNGQDTTRVFSFVLSPVNGAGRSEIFSADGQFSVSVPPSALAENAAVIVGPSSAPLPQLDAGYSIISGPFRISASASKPGASRDILMQENFNQRQVRKIFF